MASRQHSFALIGQLRAAVRPACANSRRNFASTSIASADERSGSGSGPSSSPGQANRDPSSDSRPPRKSSPLEEAKPSTISEALDPVADLGGEPGTESAKTARPSMSISSKTRGRRGRKSASSEVPAIRFDDKALQSFPPLLERSHPVFDQHDRLTVPPTDRFKYGATYTEYNNEKKPYFPGGTADQTVLARTDEHSDAERESILNRVPLTKREMAGLHMHIIDRRYPQQQTGKGKIQSLSVLTVVGNGNGLVGMANEKHEEAELAHVRSLQQAIKNMEYIKRFEGRTIHRSLVGTFSATTVYLRPRPPGEHLTRRTSKQESC